MINCIVYIHLSRLSSLPPWEHRYVISVSLVQQHDSNSNEWMVIIHDMIMIIVPPGEEEGVAPSQRGRGSVHFECELHNLNK